MTTKFVFQVMAQLSENFIFIYLGLSLFTESELEYKPLFILITVVGICVARWCAVFPLSRAINWFIRTRARRRGREAAEEIPYSHQAMLFWAGLRGAVGVALAAGLTGKNGYVLRATVLVVVVLTVIIFGGTTARMLEILGIRTGVVEEIDSDDEFDIEIVANGTFSRKSGTGFGHTPRPSANGAVPLDTVGFRSGGGGGAGNEQRMAKYSSGHTSPPDRPTGLAARRNSSRLTVQDAAEQGLLSPSDSPSNDPEEDDLDLPPQARRSPVRAASPRHESAPSTYPTSGSAHPDGRVGHAEQSRVAAATGAITQLISGLSEDPAGAFRQIDEGFIKPHLLLDPKGGGHGPGAV